VAQKISIISSNTAASRTAPLAPAVTSSWLSTITPQYSAFGNAWKLAGFSGTITPPAGTDTSHLRQIHISDTNPSGFKLETTLFGPFTAGIGYAFNVEANDLLTASVNYTLTFISENDDSVTSTAYSTTVAVSAPAISTVTASDLFSSRYKNKNGGLNTVLQFTASISNAQYPLTVTAWRNEAGSGQKWCGWFVIPSAGAAVQIGAQNTPTESDIWPPTTADQTWTLTVAVGAINSNDSIPASAVTSSAFTVAVIPAPSSTAATGAYLDSVTYAPGPGGANMFGWPHIYVTLPLSDPNFMFARLTVQTGSGTGAGFTPGGAHATETNVGDWEADDSHGDNFFRVSGTNQVYCFNPNLWDVPSDGNTTCRFKWYVASRKDDGTGATKVQQNCWSSAVGVSTPGTNAFQELAVDGTKSYTSTAKIAGSTLGGGLTGGSGSNVSIATGSGVQISGGAVALKYGSALADDGSGNATVKIAGPLFKDVSGNLNLSTSGDFVVSGGALTQNAVNLTKAYGFDTSIFGGGGGSSNLTINALAVNKLVAGTAFFAGTATFAYTTTGAYVQVGSAGAIFADNWSSPSSTVSIASSGITVAKGTNSVQVTSSGVSIAGPSGSLTATSGGIAITNTGVSLSVTANQLQIVGPSGSLVANSSGVTISNGTSSVSVTSSAVTINNASLSISTLSGNVSIGPSTTGINIAGVTFLNNSSLTVGSYTYISGFGTMSTGTLNMNTSLSGVINIGSCQLSSTSWRGPGGLQVVNSSSQWVGAGVNCPSNNVTCSSLTVGAGGISYNGSAGLTTGAFAFMKPDGSTGFLRFTDGGLVAETNF